MVGQLYLYLVRQLIVCSSSRCHDSEFPTSFEYLIDFTYHLCQQLEPDRTGTACQASVGEKIADRI